MHVSHYVCTILHLHSKHLFINLCFCLMQTHRLSDVDTSLIKWQCNCQLPCCEIAHKAHCFWADMQQTNVMCHIISCCASTSVNTIRFFMTQLLTFEEDLPDLNFHTPPFDILKTNYLLKCRCCWGRGMSASIIISLSIIVNNFATLYYALQSPSLNIF
jgi:hypothetical protein